MKTLQTKKMIKNPTWEVDFYSYPDGRIYISKGTDGKFYRSVDDGTGNGFFTSGNPEIIADSIKELAEYCLTNNYDPNEGVAWSTAHDLLDDEEFEELCDLVGVEVKE